MGDRRVTREQQIVEVAEVMLVALDDTGRVTLINPKALTILGYDHADDLLGRDWFETCVPPALSAPVKGAFGQLMAGDLEPVEYYENPVITASGEERTIAWRNALIHDDAGHIVGSLSSGSDITDRLVALEEREQLEAQIQHAQKLESLGVLAGGIAHDFNNLLMGVLGHADLAIANLSPEAAARPHVEEVKLAAQRLAELTNQMLAYSGKGTFVVEQLDLNNVVQEMGHLLSVSISKNAAIKYDLKPTLPEVEGDPSQIRQIVMNLITNASDAIGADSGIISIRSGVLDVDRDYLATTWLNEDLVEGGYVFLEVSDNGCGMDAQTVDRIFDPFFTTKRTGRGLGLAAVLGIARSHDGTIKVYSEPGKGTTFKVLLPAVEEPEMTTLDGMRMMPGVNVDGAILVVDDDEVVRSVTRSMLEFAGYEVLDASGGIEGLAIVESLGDRITAVLLDLTMPDMTGEETFRQLRRLRPDLPVVLCSGYNETDATHAFAGRGLAGFLQKPFDSTSLLNTMADVLDG
jgi:two-component system, cell cycle sensor histidine kinase and response regulator CckA